MSILLDADRLLRAHPREAVDTRGPYPLRRLLAVLCLFGITYGVVMGLYGGLADGRWLQAVYSGIKLPLLLLATFLLALPSYFVLNTLMGLRGDFAHVVRLLITAQATLTVCLAALAPLTAFWYASCGEYQPAVLFNCLMFAIASLAAQWSLRRGYAQLIRKNPRHRALLRTWLVLYALVGIQMGWILRPFIGSLGMKPQFFRAETWGNAYVVVAELVWQTLGG